MTHWSTDSFAAHQATGNLYDKLNTLFDQIVEVYGGKNKKDLVLNGSVPVKTVTPQELVSILESAKVSLEKSKFFNTSELKNLREEILSEIDQTIYLLSMK
jgi:hypothetical protein